jgi:hypothetical protein
MTILFKWGLSLILNSQNAEIIDVQLILGETLMLRIRLKQFFTSCTVLVNFDISLMAITSKAELWSNDGRGYRWVQMSEGNFHLETQEHRRHALHVKVSWPTRRFCNTFSINFRHSRHLLCSYFVSQLVSGPRRALRAFPVLIFICRQWSLSEARLRDLFGYWKTWEGIKRKQVRGYS